MSDNSDVLGQRNYGRAEFLHFLLGVPIENRALDVRSKHNMMLLINPRMRNAKNTFFMDPSEQAVLVNDFMIAVAPVVARYTLETVRLLKGSHPATRSEETEADIRRYAAGVAANITVEFASHMAARFAQLHDAAQPTSAKDSAAPIQEKAAAGQQGAQNPAH